MKKLVLAAIIVLATTFAAHAGGKNNGGNHHHGGGHHRFRMELGICFGCASAPVYVAPAPMVVIQGGVNPNDPMSVCRDRPWDMSSAANPGCVYQLQLRGIVPGYQPRVQAPPPPPPPPQQYWYYCQDRGAAGYYPTQVSSCTTQWIPVPR